MELSAALAELDRASPALLEVENRLGLTFATAAADTAASVAVSCRAATCGVRGRVVALHSDTEQPVHCGGCGAVLHCDHVLETTKTRSGTLGAPMETEVTACVRCGTESARHVTQLPPYDLASLPVSVLDQEV